MKTYFLQGLLLLCSANAMAQLNFSELKGKWQEKNRLNSQSEEMDFTDTLRIEFTESGFTQLRYHHGPTFLGEAELSGKRLKLKGQFFDVEKNNEQEIVLRAKGAQHVMRRKEQFESAPIAKVIPSATPGQSEGEVKTDWQTLAGKWTCYRKTDAAFNKYKFYIKHLDLKSLQSAELTLHSMDSVYTETQSIAVSEKTLNMTSPSGTQTYRILTSDGEELVLQQDGLVYYFKRFGKK